MRTRHLKRATVMALLYFSSAMLLAAGVLSTAHAHGDHADDVLSTSCTLCAPAKLLATPAEPAGAIDPIWTALTSDAPMLAGRSHPGLRAAFEARAPPRF
jgi:hypothetical protein